MGGEGVMSVTFLKSYAREDYIRVGPAPGRDADPAETTLR
jgi:hypothetical protein